MEEVCCTIHNTACELLPSQDYETNISAAPISQRCERQCWLHLISLHLFAITFIELVVLKFDICMRWLDDTSFACRLMMVAEWSGGSRERQRCHEVTGRRGRTSYCDTECDLAVWWWWTFVYRQLYSSGWFSVYCAHMLGFVFQPMLQCGIKKRRIKT